jgi:sensor c-di-GMP phosphodiesterase-like protein
MFQSIPALGSLLIFLLAYSLGIVVLFRANKRGLRRKWVALDFVWVPLGGLTGVCLLALWWQAHGTPSP